jgi:thiol:disulfide interchange protein
MPDTNEQNQDEPYRIPDLSEALEATKPVGEKKKVFLPEEVPPPPGDWLSHPFTKILGFLILIAIVAAIALRWSAWWGYVVAHPYGTSITVFVIAALVVILLMAYWRARTRGKRDEKYWDTR